MNEIVNKIIRLKTPVKIGATVGVFAAIVLLYYVLFYMDLSDQITAQQARSKTLQGERESYEKRKKEYVAYRDELKKLQEEQRELLKALPKRAEIPSFISSIQEQAELAGLEVNTLTIESEVPEELYVKIPVRMEVRGSYHSLTRFFKNVSELRRIVNIEALSLGVERAPDESVKLRARFIAATFRYVEKGGG